MTIKTNIIFRQLKTFKNASKCLLIVDTFRPLFRASPSNQCAQLHAMETLLTLYMVVVDWSKG
jgi:hypothetical protein